MNHHPDVRLRLNHAQMHLDYDGWISVATFAELIGRDGVAMQQHSGNAIRIPPTDPRWVMAITLIEPAYRAHHDALGLHPPDEAKGDLPFHFHPQGYPRRTHAAAHPEPSTLPEVHPGPLADAIVAAKERELGHPISPLDRPALGTTPSAPQEQSVPQEQPAPQEQSVPTEESRP